MKKNIKGKNITSFISSTGYKTFLIFKLLLEKPYSIEELQNAILKDKNIHELVSKDTIRTYINSLRSMKCEISKATKNNGKKFIMLKHPLELKISEEMLNILKKTSLYLQSKNDFKNLSLFENFILKLVSFTNNEYNINYLMGFLVLNRLNFDIYKQIKDCCKNKQIALIVYKSAGTGLQELEIICDNIFIKSSNIYIAGYNLKHNNYSSLLINRIESIKEIKPFKNIYFDNNNSVICEIYDTNYVLDNEDELIIKDTNKLIVKINGKDNFRILQKILYLGDDCKVIKPDNFREKIKNQLIEMRKLYD